MNSLLAFGIMALAGVLAALIYDIFRASRRAMGRVLVSKKEFRRLRSVFRPIQDVLSVLAAFVLFLIASYICVSGALRSYIIMGFICGILLYAGLITHCTGNLIYALFCAGIWILQLLFHRIPRRIYRIFRRNKPKKNPTSNTT